MTPSLFHLPTTPLPLGPTVIEASAGTGKTFTLAGLFLRLLLEHGLSHRSILIVTYTEAATEELRGRLRARLVEADAAFATDSESSDPLFRELQRRLVVNDPGLVHARATLQQALTHFDETPVRTIHGFCQRVLRDHAFESGSFFDMELVTDPRPLLDEVVADWWRSRFDTATDAETGFALTAGLTPNRLIRMLGETQRHPGIELHACVTPGELPRLRTVLVDRFAAAAETWRRESGTIRSFFGTGITWGNRPYNLSTEMDSRFAQLESCFGGTAGSEDFRVFNDFTPTTLESRRNQKRKNQIVPSHPFFDQCAALIDLQRQLHASWQLDFNAWATLELQRRKQERKVQSFDDLLTRLDSALTGEGGETLASTMRGLYSAALIDEFQDTDPVQWRIFRRLFGAADQRLFLIGDPKQAIYGFRGADVFTYLDAAAGAAHAHTLGTNWRSESGLVTAVNGLFQPHPCPFVVGEIAFRAVASGGRADVNPLVESGHRLPPLQLWFWAEEEPLSKTRAEPQLAEMTATEIVRLLAPATNTRIGTRTLRPGDIAVLVENHRQAEHVAAALRQRGVPSVQQIQRGIFASDEAAELTTLLAAIAEPSAGRRLRAALAGYILGLDAPRIAALDLDEMGWVAWIERFHGWLERWNTAGFLPMFRELLQSQQVRRRWLSRTDGERRLTNLLHLAELLQDAAIKRRLGVNGLRQHLAHRCANAAEAGDEELLRLERDDNAVQLVTIHRSKGLEYPVTFCPFTFRPAESSRSNSSEDLVLCHNPAARGQMIGDLGSSQRELHERLAATERLAENVRLLYVALTRARNRCYFAWGHFRDLTTAAGWLFFRPSIDGTIAPLEALSAAAGDRTADSTRAVVDRYAGECDSVSVGPPPIPNAIQFSTRVELESALVARRFTATLQQVWRSASFSWLTAGRRDEEPDYDGESVTQPDEAATPEPGSIHAFPRGTRAGVCLHQVFERIDFAGRNPADWAATIELQLRENGIDESFAPAVEQMVQWTCHAPLESGPESGFCLADTGATERLVELEFCFPLHRVTPGDLRGVLVRHGATLPSGFPHALERLEFNPVEGVLRGFIDLVFRARGRWWLVDWKSNWLGPSSEDYTPAAVASEMAAHLYPLQYLLYTLALDRWLSLRVPGYSYERDFGGVRYLFLRGIDPDRPGHGIYSDRPSPELLRDLGDLLLMPATEATR